MKSSIHVRKAQDRGHAQLGWLDSYHTFSFGHYHDPRYMGYRTLRVINEDTVQAAKGFETHAHKNMEIISYVIEGALEHQDSMGNGSVLRAGQAQRMSAGSGITHSEFNHSKDIPVHFLQIWILPEKEGIIPSYEERDIKGIDSKQELILIASPDADQGSMKIHQDAYLYFGRFPQEFTYEYTLKPGRGVWLQMISGELKVDNALISQGDGIQIENAPQISLQSPATSEFLLFDLA